MLSMRIPYDQILSTLKQETSLSEEEITAKVKTKMDQLSGLISKEGAAHIIANELGVKLEQKTECKIRDLKAGMRDTQLTLKITGSYEPKQFSRKDGGTGQVASLLLGDDTGKARLVFWNDHAPLASTHTVGSTLLISNPFVKEGPYGIELHYTADTKLERSSSSVSVAEAPAERKQISELVQGNAEVMGTIVQAFEPRFYEVCPDCGKRTKPRDGTYMCDTHGNITPTFAYLINCVLDDGTGTIRAVFFRNLVDTLLEMNQENILLYKDNPASFEAQKEKLLGKQLKLSGRVNKNEMFDRMEFVAQTLSIPNAEEELARLS